MNRRPHTCHPDDGLVCTRCQNFFAQKLPEHIRAEVRNRLDKQPFSLSANNLISRTQWVKIASLSATCPVCRLIRRLTEPDNQADDHPIASEFEIRLQDGLWLSRDKQRSNDSQWYRKWDVYPSPTAVLSRVRPSSGFKENSVTLDMSVRHDSPWSVAIANRPASLDDMSQETLVGARCQLRDCLASHLSCRSTNPKFLPWRLLDVGEARSVLDLDVRLVHWKKFPLHELRQYAALSYCWGSDDESIVRQVRTTMANLLEHHTRIHRVDLPQTIQDAIKVTRALKIRYLWVDALCIVQDNPEDREPQLPMMGAIYANAAVTICASSAYGCNDGFLKQRKFARFTVRHSWQGISDPLPMTFMEAKDSPSLGSEPIHERGWTFQETLLSRRILFFSSAGPFFWCRTPGTPAPEQRRLPTTSICTYLEHTRLRELLDVYQSDQILSPRCRWLWLVTQYSPRSFTRWADRGWAFDGVARAHKALRGGAQYSHGVWNDSLHLDLLWQSLPLSRGGKSKVCREIAEFPSWSWLSFDGPIQYPKLSGDSATASPATTQHEHGEAILQERQEVKAKDIQGGLRLLGFPQSGPMASSKNGGGGTASHAIEVRGRVRDVVVPAWSDASARSHADALPPQTRDCYGSALWDAKRARYCRRGFWPGRTRGHVEKVGQIAFDRYVADDHGLRRFVAEDRGRAPRVFKCLHVATIRPLEYEMTWVDTGPSPIGKQMSVRVGKKGYALVLEPVVLGSAETVWRRVGLLTTFQAETNYFEDGSEENMVLI